eukprot:Sspe_Gene.42548::Locus_20659_Transcript_1_1_Confidence_1.000_Length_1066::g.42548::m.42548/K06889/K06889; uncharacterized protein
MLDYFLYPVPEVSYSSYDLNVIEISAHGKPSIPAVYHYPRHGDPRFVVISFHGNASDIGHISQECQYIADSMGCAVLAPEYPGYGIASGSPGMKAFNSTAWRTFRFVRDSLRVDPSNILVLGRSIGTGVASNLARRAAENQEAVGGLCLVSPYTSILDIVQDHVRCVGTLFGHRWRPKDDLLHVRCPVLVLHGVKDTLIKPDHSTRLTHILTGTRLEERDHGALRKIDGKSRGHFTHPLWVRLAPEADHNIWDYDEDIMVPLKAFAKAHITPGKPIVVNLQDHRFTTPARPPTSLSCLGR